MIIWAYDHWATDHWANDHWANGHWAYDHRPNDHWAYDRWAHDHRPNDHWTYVHWANDHSAHGAVRAERSGASCVYQLLNFSSVTPLIPATELMTVTQLLFRDRANDSYPTSLP